MDLNDNKKHASRPHLVAVVCVLIFQSLALVAQPANAVRGICAGTSQMGLPKLDSQADLNQMELLRRCVEWNTISATKMHETTDPIGLAQGLFLIMRFELNAIFVGDFEPNKETFEQTYRAKVLEPCKLIQSATREWKVKIRKHKLLRKKWSQEIKDWLAISEICQNIIDRDPSEYYAEFERQLAELGKIQRDNTERFSMEANFVLEAMCADDNGNLVGQLHRQLTDDLEGKEEKKPKGIQYYLDINGLFDAEESEASKGLCSSIPEGQLAGSIANLFMDGEDVPIGVGASKEMFAQTFWQQLVKPCEQVHKIANKWWEEFHKRDDAGDTILLKHETICRNVLENPEQLLEEAYNNYVKLN